MFRREHVAAFSLAMASIHCTTVENGPIPDPTTGLDETAFRAKVEPILVKQCSYNACHGNTGSALRIYAPGTLRQLAYPTIDETMAPLTARAFTLPFRSGFHAVGIPVAESTAAS